MQVEKSALVIRRIDRPDHSRHCH